MISFLVKMRLPRNCAPARLRPRCAPALTPHPGGGAPSSFLPGRPRRSLESSLGPGHGTL